LAIISSNCCWNNFVNRRIHGKRPHRMGKEN
jgi:hypothetical protein